MKNERINLTPGYCKKLLPKDKKYHVRDLNCPGLWLRVLPTGFKTWFYHYRPRGKDVVFLKLGRLEMLNPSQARTRAKEIQGDIIKGNDPLEKRKKWENQLTFGEELKLWFKNSLTTPRFRKSTIKNIKQAINVWVFHKTKDPDVRKKFYLLEDLRNLKLSTISKKKHIKPLHKVISGKSPYMANRVVAYLKMFFNHVLGKNEINPCKIPRNELNHEEEYLEFLSQQELEALTDKAFVKDERSGRLLKSYYDQRSLGPVSCCLIAFQFATSRRTQDEAANIQWSWLRNGENPRLVLPKTKTSSKQKKPVLSFGLGALAMDILSTIRKEKLHEDSAFYFPPGDERNKYVFPSKDYGRITGPNAKPSKTPYVQDVRVTFKKLLAMIGITKHYKNYVTRHTVASSTLKESGNLKLVAKVLGVSIGTAAKYAKVQHDEEREVIDKIFAKRNKEKIREVK